MDKKQARVLLDKITGSWARTVNQEMRDVYGNFLMELDYDITTSTIARLQMTSKFLPSMAEIKKEYNIFKKPFEEEVSTNVECWCCMDFGLITYDKKIYIRTAVYYNEYTLYCDQCEKGNEERYDGRKIKKSRPSPYHMEPLSKYIDPADLITSNSMQYENVKDVVASRRLVQVKVGEV
jgi:hypothetical protein